MLVLKGISVMVIFIMVYLFCNVKSYSIKRAKEEEKFERRFYEAAWNLNPYNHAWVEEALRRFKDDYDSYYHNPKAIAFLEMMEEQDPGITRVVNRLSNYYYAA